LEKREAGERLTAGFEIARRQIVETSCSAMPATI
jgi:hypothetical protein